MMPGMKNCLENINRYKPLLNAKNKLKIEKCKIKEKRKICSLQYSCFNGTER